VGYIVKYDTSASQWRTTREIWRLLGVTQEDETKDEESLQRYGTYSMIRDALQSTRGPRRGIGGVFLVIKNTHIKI
jgi:hypothetical protein